MGNPVPIPGKSGNVYNFEEYSFGDDFDNKAAVYIYVNSLSELISLNISHPFVYIGESEDLNDRMNKHLNKNDNGEHACAMKHGAEHLLIHYAPDPFFAQGIASHTPKEYVVGVQNDLLARYNTPCNTQHNTWAEKKSS